MATRDKLVGAYFEARAATNGVVRRFDSMPWLLRLLCIGSLGAGIAMLVICTFQVGTFGIHGEQLSWAQIRAAGYYPFLLISALAMALAGLGIWLHRAWARWFVVSLPLIESPIEIIYRRSHLHADLGFPWKASIGAVVWAAFFYWYFFCNQKKAFD